MTDFRSDPDWDEPLRLPDITTGIHTILVPVDGSEGSERGLAYASLMAQLAGARIVVVTAFDPPVTMRRRGIIAVESARSELEADAKELAGEAAQLLVERGHEATAVVVRGDPALAILQAAGEENADMIVMGRRGLGRLQGLLVGSVSERVARLAEIPVLFAS